VVEREGRLREQRLRGRGANLGARLAQDGAEARARVQHVHGGVAARVEHPVVVEDVVAVAVALEVGVLDRAVAEHARRLGLGLE